MFCISSSILNTHPIPVDLRECDGRNTHQIALHGSANSARVDRIVSHIGAVIDARDDQVRFITKQASQGNMNAISRCTCDVSKTIAGGANIDG